MRYQPAAAYVRMSTDHQEYSIENQKVAIREFAYKRGFRVVRSYEDPGRSGITFSNRPGLQHLIRDVVSHCLGAKAILVYDISRWGRFQDCDEAAHYEFICRANGIPVLYCAESFDNDTSEGSTLLKAVKRTMAAQFSRELGEHVTQMKKMLVEQGIRVGGVAPIGFRRAAVSPTGVIEQVLEAGMRNASPSRRIVLVPGPTKEVRLVRRIFDALVNQRKSCSEIARELNIAGLFNRLLPWNPTTVQNVLTNPVYEGSNVWGRTSQRMRGPCTRVRPECWIVKPRAFTPLVDPAHFERAQAELRRRGEAKVWDDDKIVRATRDLLRRKGRLSISLMEKTDNMPSSRTVRVHFGSYRALYDLIGYQCRNLHTKRAETGKNTLLRRAEFVREVVGRLNPHVIAIQRNSRCTLVIDGQITVLLYFCPALRLPSGSIRWNFRPSACHNASLSLVCLLDGDCRKVSQMRLFSSIASDRYLSRIAVGTKWFAAGKRVNSIDELYPAIQSLA